MSEKLYGEPEQLKLTLPDCYYMTDCSEELIIEPENNKYLVRYSDDDVVSAEINESLWEFATDPVKFINSMRDATSEEIECIDRHIKERSYPTGVCFWDNWHLGENNETAINEIDDYIAKINSLPMPAVDNCRRGFTETFEDWGFTEEDMLEFERMINMKEIKIKYFTDKIEKLKYIGGSTRSNWIDLRAAETIELKAGEFKLIPLGVAMKLPAGYEAHIAPRSSTFKTWGLIQCNSVGVVDESYCGDTDQWMMPVYATRDTTINVNDRVCQFRIIENQPTIEFVEVEHMEDESRGGFGSSGKQ